MSELLIFRGMAVEKRVPLAERAPALRIGRARENDIELPDASKAVSRVHAELRYENGQFLVVDLNSENGIWKNGERLAAAPLEPGEAIALGPFRLLLDNGGDDSQTVFRPLPAPRAAEHSGAPREVAGFLMSALPASLQSRPRIAALAATGFVVAILAALLWVGGSPAELREVEPAHEAASAATEPPSEPQPAPPVRDAPIESAHADNTPAPEAATPAVPKLEPVAETPPAASLATPRSPARAPSGPATPAFEVARRTGEGNRAYRARVNALQGRFEIARGQMDRGEVEAAIAGLTSLLADEPGQPAATALFARALDQQRAAIARRAQDAMAEAVKLEAAENLPAAEAQYARAGALGAAGADASAARVRARRVELGNRAFANAKQFHSIGSRLNEAIAEYERAILLLPKDHPNHPIAAERLRAARSGR